MYSTILVALDGSEHSLAGGRLALALAQALGSELVACHAFDVAIHTHRFREMEPGLPGEYQGESMLSRLREAHRPLISDGFRALSLGYLEDFLAGARERGVAAQEAVAEGRNYVVLLEAVRERGADLVALGAHGLGASGDGLLGSTATRVLRGAAGDVLVARPGGSEAGPVLVGLDGSDEALGALRRGATLARTLGRPLEVAAAYDPEFHKSVFGAMARSLSTERQEQVGLCRQEALHDKFIDEGLARLYRGFLDQGVERAAVMGGPATSALLRGKAYRALVDHAKELGASLIVVGRFGHHRGRADIGSNAEAVARLAPCSVLVTAAAQVRREEAKAMKWDADASARLERIPPFARPMARQGIEQHVRERGGARVTLDDVREVGRRLGMGGE